MKITKDAYEILKPAARSYWVAMNESTKSITPATAKLRESLLAKNDIPSNLALIEMMVQEEGEAHDDSNDRLKELLKADINKMSDEEYAQHTQEIKKLTNVFNAKLDEVQKYIETGKYEKGSTMEQMLARIQKDRNEKELQKLKNNSQETKTILQRIDAWINNANKKVADWFRMMWKKYKTFSIIYLILIAAIAILLVLYIMKKKDSKTAILLKKSIIIVLAGGSLVVLINVLKSLFVKNENTQTKDGK